MKKLTMHQIIDETVEYYTKNPRSLNGGICLYNGPNGEKCAFSRCCTKDSVFHEGSLISSHESVKLLPQYTHYPIKKNIYFWIQIQSIHDTSEFWDGNIFTDEGKEFVSVLKKLYNN